MITECGHNDKHESSVTFGLKVLIIILLIGCTVLAVRGLLGRSGITQSNRSFFLLSRRDRSADVNLEEYAAAYPDLSYMRADSAFAKSVLEKVPASLRSQALILVPTADPSRATSDSELIRKTMSEVAHRKLDVTRVPFAIVGALGLLIGISLRRLYAKVPFALFSGLTLLAAWKYGHSCPTCPVAFIGGVDSALFGTVLYGVVALGTLLNPRIALTIGSPICGIAGLWQLMQVINDSQLCVPCTVVFFSMHWLFAAAYCVSLYQMKLMFGRA
jgi:hypothetical protein